MKIERKRRRWAIHDYGSQGHYYVTICTQNRIPFFGKMKSLDELDISTIKEIPYLTPSEYVEKIACKSEMDSDLFFEIAKNNNPFIEPSSIGLALIQCWIDIPNHFPFAKTHEFILMNNHIHGVISIHLPESKTWNTPKFGPQSKNLFSIIRGFKIGVTKLARQFDPSFQWQRGYYDRVIRNEIEHDAIRTYLHQNPENWYLKNENSRGR